MGTTPYTVGYWAYKEGKTDTQNPYDLDDPRHQQWADGWEAASEEDVIDDGFDSRDR